MSNFAPDGYYIGPTSLVMQIIENTGYKGISQNVAVAASQQYTVSIWVRPDRDGVWRTKCVPQSGSTVTVDTDINANEWNLVAISWTPSANGYGTVEFITADVGLYEIVCGQFCRLVGEYDPSEHIVPNGWTRGGLAADPTPTATIERFDDTAPYDWNEVIAETTETSQSWASKLLSGGAFTYSLRDIYFPLDTDLYYRARVNHESAAVSSPNSGAAPVGELTDNRWLFIPSLPGRTGQPGSGDVIRVNQSSSTFASTSSISAGVFHGLGREKAIVVSDTAVTAETGTMSLGFQDANSYALFEAIRKAQCPVLMRASKYGFQRWIRFIGDRSQAFFLGTGNVRPMVTAQWVEVDPPEGS